MPIVVAHRGYSSLYEDNSWDAITQAFSNGADICEIDVHLTKDGKIFLYHDYILDGFLIAETEYSILKKKYPQYPELKEVITWALEKNKQFIIEVKDRRMLNILASYIPKDLPDLFIVASFDGIFLKEFKNLRPDVQTCLILGSVFDGSLCINLTQEVSAEFLIPAWEHRHPYPHTLLDDKFLKFAKESDIKIITWHEERGYVLKHLIEKDLYGISTNDPPLVRRLLNERIYRKNK